MQQVQRTEIERRARRWALAWQLAAGVAGAGAAWLAVKTIDSLALEIWGAIHDPTISAERRIIEMWLGGSALVLMGVVVVVVGLKAAQLVLGVEGFVRGALQRQRRAGREK